jgi:autotransporter family porin
LFKNGVSTPTDGDWYLRSTLIPTPTKPTTPIYRPGTSNYVSAQTANAEQGFLALSTLHERMNEQQVVSTDKQTWARYYGNTESNNGDSRFNYNQHISAVQVGQDLYNKTTDNGTDVHSGIMFDYSNSEVDFADRAREDALLDNTTGNLEARSYGLGGYYIAINGDESYLDVVGMVSKLDNKFEDSYGMKSTQDGYRLGLSVEAGKKLAELGKWKVEGQGQLAYQYTNYDNFNDDISGIDGYGASTLRGRLGVRVYRHLESTKNIQQIDNAQVYGVANVIQDFINPTDVAVGGTNVSEKFDKTTLEVGGGFQVPVTGTTYVYTDARYDRSIKGNKEQGKLTIGFKTQF